MAEQNDSGIFREIDEELRHDQMTAMAKRYGPIIAAVVILLIGGVGGYKIWEHRTFNSQIQTTDAFIDAIALEDESADADAALDAYRTLAENRDGDIAAFARFRQANVLAEAGDTPTALQIYGSLERDSDLPQTYRDVASLYAATLLLNSGDANAALERVEALLAEDNPWRHSAREIAAVANLERGQVDEARGLLQQITGDASAPQGSRERATQLLLSAGGS